MRISFFKYRADNEAASGCPSIYYFWPPMDNVIYALLSVQHFYRMWLFIFRCY